MSEASEPRVLCQQERTEQARQVVSDWMRRRAEGDAISDECLIQAHPELLPELADRLRKVRVVEAAQQEVDSDRAASSPLHVRCPHCHVPVDIGEDSQLSGLPCPSCGSQFNLVDPSPPVSPAGPNRIGHFELLERLGVGAFGTVWSARDTELDRLVAIKFPRVGHIDAEATEKLIREARAAAQLTHPHIVRIHEVGREGDRIYLVTDFVEGQTLADWLVDQTGTPVEAARLIATLAAALDHAHQRGVIHRDLKPANVMLDATGEPHLMDFGLAKRDVGEVTVTLEGKLLGTPAYMSPEQARGTAHAADGRSDIYSLGVMLYELLTGERPFRGSTRMLLHQILIEDPPRPRTLQSGVPRDLETICLKCLEKDADRRYQTAAELRNDLQRFLHGQPVRARPLGRPARSWRWSRRNPLPAGLWAALAVSVLVGLAGVTSMWRRAVIESEQAHTARQLAEDAAEQRRRQLYLSDINLAQNQWNAHDVDHCREALSRHIPQVDQRDLRGFEWYYLWRLCQQDAVTPTLPRHEIGSIAVSPDGKMLATTALGVLQLWNLQTHQQLFTADAHTDLAIGLAFSPDGQWLATSGWDGKVKLWTLDGDNKPIVLYEHAEPVMVMRLAFSREGLLAASCGQLLLVWDLEDRRLVHRLDGDEILARDVTFSPDGTLLASAGSDKTVKLWDISSGKQLQVLRGHADHVFAVTFAPDGKTLASAGKDRVIHLWNVGPQPGEAAPRTSLLGHTRNVCDVAFSPDGKLLASAGWDGTVRLWDPQAEQLLETLKGHSGRVFNVAFTPDGRTLASDSIGKVKLWELSATTARDGLVGNRVQFLANGTLMSWTKEGTLRLWDAETGEPNTPLSFRQASGSVATLSPDGRRLAVSTSDGVLELHDLETGDQRRLPAPHNRRVAFLEFSPTGTSLMAAVPDDLKLWDLRSDEPPLDLAVSYSEGRVARACSPDDSILAIGCRDTPGYSSLKLLDLNRKTLVRFDQNSCPFTAAAFSADGQLFASGDWAGEIKIWNVRQPTRPLHQFAGHADSVFSLAFSPDGTRLASASADGTVKLWNLETGDETITLQGDGSRIFSVAFAPDGATLAAASEDDTVQLWRAGNPK